jgi:transcriptional regulator
MHPAPDFLEQDDVRLRGFIAAKGFGLIIAQSPEGPICTHAPVLLNDQVLRFHLSRGSALNAALAQDPRALCVITGPDAYISPDWYGLEDQVPTWNYVSAEISGTVRTLSGLDAATMLDDLSAVFEARLAPKPPWTRAKMTPARFEAMVSRGITAYEMEVTGLTGTRKLSQNKPQAAVRGVQLALASMEDDPGALALADLMKPAASEG